MRSASVDGSGRVLDRSAAPNPHDARGPDALIALATDEVQAEGDTSFAEAFNHLLGCIRTKAASGDQRTNERKGRTVKISIIGLGKMGAKMSERLRRAGHEVVGYDRDPDIADVGSLAEAVSALDGQPRRVVWVMVPSGAPTNATVDELSGLLSDGDLVIDGGNSNFRDSPRHAARP